MDLASFKRSLDGPGPPAPLSAELRALWHAAKGGWEEAHKLVQDESGAEAEIGRASCRERVYVLV